MEKNKIYQGDCIEELKKLPDNSVDAIITDPPYGLGFMNKEWDSFPLRDRGGRLTGSGNPTESRGFGMNVAYGNNLQTQNALQEFSYNWAKECLRVLKPGAFLLSFGGTRTYHRMACGIEDAGFEIRDTIMWVYGSGFPKSLNIGKQIDKIQGVEQEKVEYEHPQRKNRASNYSIGFSESEERKNEGGSKIMKGIATSELAKEWEGWGTSLKPAVEPIVVARKPLSEKNVALNVLKWGTGGINIDESRIPTDEKLSIGSNNHSQASVFKHNQILNSEQNSLGRFPSNLILDEESAKMLDEQTGNIGCSSDREKYKGSNYGTSMFLGDKPLFNSPTYTDKGGASRFFYVAKASKSERNEGLDGFEEKGGKPNELTVRGNTNPVCLNCYKSKYDRGNGICNCEIPNYREPINLTQKNNHPTVKPVALMEYLIKLVSKENAVILDPFLGSGTTAIACLKLNRNFIGIEKEADYVKIAEARIKPHLSQTKLNKEAVSIPPNPKGIGYP